MIARTLEIAVAYWKYKFTSAPRNPLPVFSMMKSRWTNSGRIIHLANGHRNLHLFLGLGESVITNSYGLKTIIGKVLYCRFFLPNESGFLHCITSPDSTIYTNLTSHNTHSGNTTWTTCGKYGNTESTEGNLSILRCGAGFVLSQATATWDKFFALW